MKRPTKGPTGSEALGEIGLGLGKLFEGLRDVIEQAESSSDGTHKVHRSGGENGRPEIVTSFTSGTVDEFLKARGKTSGDDEDVAASAQYTPDYGSAEAGIATPDAAELDAAKSWEMVEADDHYLFICDLTGRSRNELDVLVEDGDLVARFGGDGASDIRTALPADVRKDDPFHRVRNGIAEVRLERKQQTEGVLS
ncbi:MAG: hypothetical protein AAF737_06010 [Pseudomonadota bacterium]